VVRKSAAFLVTLGLSFGAVRAAGSSAADWKYANPFCGAVAEVAPLSDGSGYGLLLATASGTTIEAHVTLISDTDAYDAHISDTNLLGPPEDRESAPVAIRLPTADTVKYYFVDSYAIDRGGSVTCPSYIFAIGSAISGSAGATATFAQHLQALGQLKCAHAYQGPSTRRDAEGIVGHFGNRPLSTKLDVYVDSNGRAVDEKVVRSSGVEGVDAAAVGNVAQQLFVPAEFLCTPVVGELEVRVDYKP
jgi:hypothetical protein